MGNPRAFVFYLIIVIVLMSVLIIILATIFSPYVSYEGVTNRTLPFVGTQYQLSFNSVPTIINGITASTSIIIGFTGAIIGIIFQIFKDNIEMRNILLISAFLESFPLLLLLIVYIVLTQGFVDSALRLSLVAFAYSLLIFAIVMLGSFLRLARKGKTSIRTETSATKEPVKKEGEESKSKENENNKNVNVFVNVS